MTNIESKALKPDFSSHLKALFDLMKPRVMSLVIFTCAVGLLIAPIFFSDIKTSACRTLWSFEIVQICFLLFNFKKFSILVIINYDLLIVPDKFQVATIL